MAKKHHPWWTNDDSLFGGETFEAEETKSKLGVKKGDVFRLERRGRSNVLIPHPSNQGAWAHDKKNPVRLKKVDSKKNKRAFSMQVKLSPRGKPETFFLVERKNGTVAIRLDPDSSESNGGTASIRR